MKYDDASWHYGGDFPNDLPESAGATHIAMFLSWAVLNNLAGEIHTVECAAELEELIKRETTPGAWLLMICDGKFTDEDLSEVGNKFAHSYYANDDGLQVSAGSYLHDYEKAFSKRRFLFPKYKSLYYVPDTWKTFSIIAPIIEARYANWSKVGDLSV